MKEKNWGNKGNGDTDDAKERNAAVSIVSFSSEKEVEEACPPFLLPLGDAMMIQIRSSCKYKQTIINMILKIIYVSLLRP